jgi:hypothetical protein
MQALSCLELVECELRKTAFRVHGSTNANTGPTKKFVPRFVDEFPQDIMNKHLTDENSIDRLSSTIQKTLTFGNVETWHCGGKTTGK